MNLHFFCNDPVQCATWLDDVRKRNAIKECAQMLSSAIRYWNPDTTLPVYEPAYLSHPVTRWVRTTSGNFKWTMKHYEALIKQNNAPHKSADLIKHLTQGYFVVPTGGLTSFPNCAARKEYGISFKHIPDVNKAYRLYMSARWDRDRRLNKIKLSWNNGEMPSWYVNT